MKKKTSAKKSGAKVPAAKKAPATKKPVVQKKASAKKPVTTVSPIVVEQLQEQAVQPTVAMQEAPEVSKVAVTHRRQWQSPL